MEMNEIENKRKEIVESIVKCGIEKEEVDSYFDKELQESYNLQMTEKDANFRALVSTSNYYRKYLDKLGNRIKFCALGITMVSDYGLSFKVKEIQRKLNSEGFTPSHKQDYIRRGIIDEHYNILYTSDLTPISDKHGKVVNIEEELTQKLYGVIEIETGEKKPVVLSVFGKEACMEKKFLFKWCLISADVKVKETGVVLTSRELLMKQISCDRISKEEYEGYVNEFFKLDTIDVEDIKNGNFVMPEKGGTFFFINGVFLNFNFFSGTTMTEMIPKSDLLSTTSNIIADVRIPDVVPTDIDPKLGKDIWVFGNVRKGDNDRYKLIVYGIYTDEPIDLDVYKIDEGLISVNEVSEEKTETKTNDEEFFSNMSSL